MPKIKILTTIEKKAIQEFKLELLKKLGQNILKILLFGSKARGDFHKESDIDILVVLKKEDRKSKEVVANLAFEIEEKYNFKIYLSVLSLDWKKFKYLSSLQTNFALNLSEDGISLWQSKELQKL